MARKQTPRKDIIFEFARNYHRLNLDVLRLRNQLRDWQTMKLHTKAMHDELRELIRTSELQVGLLAVMAEDMGIVEEIYALRSQVEAEEKARVQRLRAMADELKNPEAHRLVDGELTPEGKDRYTVAPTKQPRIY